MSTISCGSLEDKILIELNHEAQQINKHEQVHKNTKGKLPPPDDLGKININNLLLYIDKPVVDVNFVINPISLQLIKHQSINVTYALSKNGYPYKVRVIVNYIWVSN